MLRCGRVADFFRGGRSGAYWIGGIVLALAPADSALAQGYFQKAIVVQGETAPDAGGATFLNFGGGYSINPAGDLAFRANLSDSRRSIYKSAGGTVSAVALEGDSAPAPATGTYATFIEAPAISATGEVGWSSELSTAGTSGLFLDSAGTHTVLRLTGDAAPVPGGASYADDVGGPYALLPSGDFAFRWNFTGGSLGAGCDEGVFTTLGGVDAAVALECDPAPGTGGGTLGSLFGSWMNGSGAVTFLSLVTDGVLPFSIPVYVGSGGTVTKIAVEGDTAPGTGGGTFNSVILVANAQTLGAGGDVVFRAGIAGGTSTFGIFLSSGGTVTAVALEGETAPGTGGQVYSSLSAPSMNDAGDIVFTSAFAGGAIADGIFIDVAGTQSAVALSGDPAPGTGGGVYEVFSKPVIDAIGRVTFGANVLGGSADRGIFRASPASVPIPPVAIVALGAALVATTRRTIRTSSATEPEGSRRRLLA